MAPRSDADGHPSGENLAGGTFIFIVAYGPPPRTAHRYPRWGPSPSLGKRRSGRLGSTLMSEHLMTGYDSARRAIPSLVHRAEPSRGRRRAPRGRRGIRKAGRRILVGHPARGARRGDPRGIRPLRGGCPRAPGDSAVVLRAAVAPHERSTISMLTPSGTWMRISWRNARSSASRSMSRLWIRISQRPHVSLPSPSGDFRTGTTSRFVGRGIGPAIATPVRSLISLICWHTLSTFFGSVPLSEMRAFWGMVQPRERKQKATASALLDVDDLTRRDGLSHVPDREAPHLRERLERLDDEGVRRSNLDAGRVAGLEEVGLFGLRRARLRGEGRDDLLEGARDLGRMGVEDRRVPGRDDARVIETEDLRGERLGDRRRGVRRAGDVPSAGGLLVEPP